VGVADTPTSVRLTRRGKTVVASAVLALSTLPLVQCLASAERSAASATGSAVDDGNGRPVTLAFAGDVHFEGPLADAAAHADTIIGPLAGALAAADLAVLNLETSVGGKGTAEPKRYTFDGPANALKSLSADGVDVVSLANNHGMDFGVEGLAGTMDAARDAGLATIGAGEDAQQAYMPFRTTIDDQRITVLAATQVLDNSARERWTAGPDKPGLASAYEQAVLVNAVRQARESSDTVIVVLHWGVERDPCPPERAQQLALALSAAGADILVGGHSHVLGGEGFLGSTYVHYGLGNFLFYNSRGPTAETGVLTLTVRGSEVTDVIWQDGVNRDGVPHPVSDEEQADRELARQERRACTGLEASPS